MKKIFRSLMFVLAISLLFSSVTFAKSDNAKKSLVALGDSIPYGYNLGNTNEHPSRDAFPYLIGEDADLRVRNLGEPGWTTDQLINTLETDQKFRQAIRHADYITLNIGNNDLLAVLNQANIDSNGNPNLFMLLLNQRLPVATQTITANLGDITQQIRLLTDAPIAVYNIYNPFQVDNPMLHNLGNLVLPGFNYAMGNLTSTLNLYYSNVLLADAFTAFGIDQATYVIRDDIHPTKAGQEVLAQIGLEALGLEQSEQVAKSKKPEKLKK
jgi:lysophospholipase L1-like esterase